MTETQMVIPDQTAEQIWSPLFGNFVGPEHWAGKDNLRAFILSSIRDRSPGLKRKEDRALHEFIETLDHSFRLSYEHSATWRIY